MREAPRFEPRAVWSRDSQSNLCASAPPCAIAPPVFDSYLRRSLSASCDLFQRSKLRSPAGGGRSEATDTRETLAVSGSLGGRGGGGLAGAAAHATLWSSVAACGGCNRNGETEQGQLVLVLEAVGGNDRNGEAAHVQLRPSTVARGGGGGDRKGVAAHAQLWPRAAACMWHAGT